MDLEKRVIEEIKEWANQVLDKPNPFLTTFRRVPTPKKLFYLTR